MEPDSSPRARTSSVTVESGGVLLHGDLTLPAQVAGLVLFAHGSGSSRLSPRNRAVAARLVQAGLGTLLLDLLTPREEASERAGGLLRFDIALLAGRLEGAIDWLLARPASGGRPLGLFGASTGAAAALVAAARRPRDVRAVVSRGGRPDLAEGSLAAVRAPTLLIVGELDEEVLELNRQALQHLCSPAELAVVPGATHLFEEPGALEEVTRLATAWFMRHLASEAPDPE